MNILFVCTGNTCRSAMGEAILKKIIIDQGIVGVSCFSAGIFASEGEGASVNSISVCNEIDVDISSHVSKHINSLDLNNIDIFIAVSQSHAEVLLSMGIDQDKLYVLNEIKDPFQKDEETYRKCRDQLYSEVNELWRLIRKRLN